MQIGRGKKFLNDRPMRCALTLELTWRMLGLHAQKLLKGLHVGSSETHKDDSQHGPARLGLCLWCAYKPSLPTQDPN